MTSRLTRPRRSLDEIMRIGREAGRVSTGAVRRRQDMKAISLGLEDEDADGSGTSPYANWIPELPMPLDRQVDIDSRMPEADFVPETVTDPALRKIMKRQIMARQRDQIAMRRAEGQWGGQLSGLVPPGSPLLAANFIPGTNQPIGTQNFTTGGSVLQWNSTADHPEAVNLQLSYSFDVSATAADSLNTDDTSVYAKVEWGGGSANQLAYVDYGQGTQLRLTASYVRVSALYLPQSLPTGWPAQPVGPVEGFPVTGPTLTVTAMLGLGFPAFRTSSARFTQKLSMGTSEGGSPAGPFPIPLFASAFGLAFYSADGGSGTSPVDVDVYVDPNANGPLQPGGTIAYHVTGSATEDNVYMIPQGCRFLTLVNQGSFDLNVNLVYSLLL